MEDYGFESCGAGSPHFGYEERKLASVLNAMEQPGRRGQTPDFLRTDDDPGPPRAIRR